MYTRASFANLTDSRLGYVIFFCRKQWLVQYIKLAVKTIKRITRSSLAAEAIARLDGLDATLSISELLKET